jgi:hypothetical protein
MQDLIEPMKKEIALYIFLHKEQIL